MISLSQLPLALLLAAAMPQQGGKVLDISKASVQRHAERAMARLRQDLGVDQ